MKLIFLIFTLKIFCAYGETDEANSNYGCRTFITDNRYPSYFSVIGSGAIRPNEMYDVSVSSHNLKNFNRALHLIVEITGGPTTFLQDVRVEKGTTKVVRFETQNLPPGSYNLAVTEPSTGFNDTQPLHYLKKTYSLIIQTDKPIYNVGDMVKYRIFSYDSQTRPYSLQNLTKCFVTDAANNKIFDWKNVKFVDGVYENEFRLASKVVLGSWTITFNGPNDETAIQSFDVAEYVLPFTTVALSGPSDIAIDAGNFPITASALYTSSRKPAVGKFKLSCTFYYNGSDHSFEKSASTTGNSTFDISISKDLKVTTAPWDLFLWFTVEFTDDLTKKTATDSKLVSIHINKYTIEMFSQQNGYFEGMPYSYTLTVKRIDGSRIGLETKYEDRKIIVNKVAYYFNEKGEVDIYIKAAPQNLTYFEIKATFKDVTFDDRVYKQYESQSKSLMLIRKQKTPKLYDVINFEIFTSENVKFVFCLVYSKSLLRRSQKVDIYSKKGSFNLKTSFDDAPVTRVIAFYVATDGSLVGDVMEIYFRNDLPYKVNFTFSKDEFKPGDNISLSVCSNAESNVHLAAIDQRVLQLLQRQDIQADTIMSELENYNHFYPGPVFDIGPVKRPGGGFFPRRYTPPWMDGIILITNGIFPISPWHPIPQELANVGGNKGPVPASQFRKETSSPSASNIKLRSRFDETFLWQSVRIQRDCAKVDVTIPDSITKWIVTGISFNKISGLGLNDPFNFTVFMPFYVQFNLPYSVKRKEAVVLDVLLFNYLKTSQNVVLSLDKRDTEFSLIDPLKFNWKVSGNTFTQSISIKSNEVISVKLKISAKQIGFITLSLTAVGGSAGDKIEEKLRIIPEGVAQYINNATFIQLKGVQKQFDKTLTCVLPPNAVLDTVTVSASVVGDIIGSSLTNIDRLIQTPYGCGEQNMITLVPNILVLYYLRNTNQLTPENRDSGINNIQIGYQTQLTYKLLDGSFSAFGESDGNGSTWLTAFVAKSFIQAKEFVPLDPTVIDRALEFIISKQQDDGSFVENGRVIHKDMQGASGTGLALTCYLVVVLKSSVADHPQYSVPLQKALALIVNSLSSTSDVYDLSVCMYALQLNNNPSASNLKASFLALGTETSSDLHWVRSTNTGLPGSLSIEMTAYALLYFQLINDLATSLKILKWLISQQNSFGGYSSTQDTVVGLQAISAIAVDFLAKNTNLELSLKPNVGQTYNAYVDKNNALTVQNFALPLNARSLAVAASGTGFAVVQLTCNCYVVDDNKSPSFGLNVSFVGSCENYIKIGICLNYLPKSKDDTSSNMVVVEIQLPSGYVSDRDAKSEDISQTDVKNGGTIAEVYINKVTTKPICFNISAVRNCEVSDLAKSTIEVYDFYDTTKKASIMYELPKLAACQGSPKMFLM